MTLPQPGQVQRFDTGIVLSSLNDIPLISTTTTSGYRFIYNSSQFCIAEYDTDTHYMEMNVWGNDGGPASNFFIGDKYVLDVNYDKNDNVYYAVRWNNDINYRGLGFSFTDYTEGGPESARTLLEDEFTIPKVWQNEYISPLNHETVISYRPPRETKVSRVSRRWTDYSARQYSGYPSTWNTDGWGHESAISSTTQTKSLTLLEVDEDNEVLVYYSNGGLGYIDFDVEVTGNFVAFLDLNVTAFEDDCVASLRVLRPTTSGSVQPFNQMASISYRGPHTSPRLETWTVSYDNDTSASFWDIHNLRINERYLHDGAGGITTVSGGASKIYKIQVDGYRNGLTGPSVFGSFDTSEHIMAFSVRDTYANYGYGILGSNIALDDIDLTINPTYYTYGDIHRSFSWVGSSGQLMGFDIKAGYEFDPINGEFIDPISSSVKGTSIDVTISNEIEVGVPGIDNDKLRVAIKRVGTTLYLMKRDNTVDGGSYTDVTTWDSGYSGRVKFELFVDASAGSAAPDIVFDRFVVRDLFPSEETGAGVQGTASWPHPVLTVESFDLDGSPAEAFGVSDGVGVVIGRLDVINSGVDSTGSFNNFLGNVQIATNHDSASVSGELYIRINDDFYKYLKSDLPIVSNEIGLLASKFSPGALIGSPRGSTLNWNGYTEAGLIYIAENEADIYSGMYVNCIRHTTMSGNFPAKFAWIEESDIDFSLYATDPNQPFLLYGLSAADKKVYLYNLDEDKAAFCNVVSQKQIMGASTAETSLVTAQVLNVYGDPLESKIVTFDVSSGDGSVSPSSDTTDSIGEASTIYTVGSTVGTADIRATVTN